MARGSDNGRSKPSQERKRVLLDSQIETLKRMVSMCEEMKDGGTETALCKKYDVDKSTFRKFLFNQKLGFSLPKTFDPPTFEEEDEDDNVLYYHRFYGNISANKKEWLKEYDSYNWQERLFASVFNEYNYANIPPTVAESMDEVLKTLTEREQQVLHYRFEDCMTLKETGKMLGVQQERIRQIEAKALRKLRHPSRSIPLRFGHDFYEKLLERKIENYNKSVNKAVERLSAKISSDTDNEDIETLLEIRDRIDGFLNSIANKLTPQQQLRLFTGKMIKDVPIHELELSVRGYNCLIRAGIRTVADLNKKTYEEMLRVRNLGKVTLQEVMDKVAPFGVVFKDENGFEVTQVR